MRRRNKINPKKKGILKRIQQKGFSMVEVMVAASILAVSVASVSALQSQVYQQVRRTNDRSFAAQKATQMFEELRSFVQANREEPLKSLQDYFSNGASEYVPTLTTEKRPDQSDPNNHHKDFYLQPNDPLSANTKVQNHWKFVRQVLVEPVPSDENARHVTVKVWYADQSGTNPINEDMPLAVISGILKTNIEQTPPTQVYDIYALGLENVSGWWVDVSTLRPIFDRTLDDLAARNPGLEFRKHYISRLGYGRDPFYTPYINTADDLRDTNTPFVYMYPGNISKSANNNRVTEVYVDNVIKGRRINDDTSQQYDIFKKDDAQDPNPDNASGNYRGYALADQYNTDMRYPDEMATYNRLNTQYKTTHAGASDLEPSLRMLLEGMHSDPEKYRNSMIANLHGELLPMPPIRNYSDPAKIPCDETFDSDTTDSVITNHCLDPKETLSDTSRATNMDEWRYSNMRVVTHPENIYYQNSAPIKLRVYAYETRRLGDSSLPTWPSNTDPTSTQYKQDIDRSTIEKTSIFIPTDGKGHNPKAPGSLGYLNNPSADMSAYNSTLESAVQITKIVGDNRKAYEYRQPTPVSNHPFLETTDRDLFVNPTTEAAKYSSGDLSNAAYWNGMNNKIQPIVVENFGNHNGRDDNPYEDSSHTVDDATEARSASALLDDNGSGLGRVWSINSGSNPSMVVKVSNSTLSAAESEQLDDLIDELVVIGNTPAQAEIVRVRDISALNTPADGFVTLDLYSAPTGSHSTLSSILEVLPPPAPTLQSQTNVGNTYSSPRNPGLGSGGNRNYWIRIKKSTYNNLSNGDTVYFPAPVNAERTVLYKHTSGGGSGKYYIELNSDLPSQPAGNSAVFKRVYDNPSPDIARKDNHSILLGKDTTAASMYRASGSEVYDPDVYPLVTRHKDYDVTGKTQTPYGLDTNGILINLYDTPTRQVQCGSGGITCHGTGSNPNYSGLPSSRVLYGQEYIPAPVGSDFSRDLTERNNGVVKNTARWIVSLDRSGLPGALQDSRLTFETRMGRTHYSIDERDSAAANQAILEQGLSGDGDAYRPNSSSGSNENETTMRKNLYNVSRTYVWSGDVNGDGVNTLSDDVPFSEQFQFMGDPRFMPYLDVKNYNGYNMAFVSNADQGHASGAGSSYSGFNFLGPGMVGSGGVDFVRYSRLYVDSVMKSSSIYNAMSGYSNYYFGYGGDMGADSNNTQYYVNNQSFTRGDDSGNTFIANNKVSDVAYNNSGRSKLVYSDESNGSNRWANIFWQGDMFPDEEYDFWKYNGNLPTHGFSNAQNKCPPGFVTGTAYACQRNSKDTYWRADYTQPPFSLPNRRKNPNTRGAATFMNGNYLGSGNRNFAHNPQETSGRLTSGAGSILNRAFNLSLEAKPGANRPFKVDADQNKPGIYNNSIMSSVRNKLALTNIQTGADETSYSEDNTYYRKNGDNSRLVSATVKASRGSDFPGGYFLINGLKKAGAQSEVSLARFSVAGMLQSYLNGNDIADGVGDDPARMRLIPRVEITDPTASDIFEDETSIPISFRSQWLRWDLEKYSPAFPANWREDLQVQFIFKYSDDAGKTWYYLDGTSAKDSDGEYVASKVYDDGTTNTFTVPGGGTGLEKTLNWDVSSLDGGTYLLRVECYREENGKVLHNGYSYHQVFVTLRKN